MEDEKDAKKMSEKGEKCMTAVSMWISNVWDFVNRSDEEPHRSCFSRILFHSRYLNNNN